MMYGSMCRRVRSKEKQQLPLRFSPPPFSVIGWFPCATKHLYAEPSLKRELPTLTLMIEKCLAPTPKPIGYLFPLMKPFFIFLLLFLLLLSGQSGFTAPAKAGQSTLGLHGTSLPILRPEKIATLGRQTTLRYERAEILNGYAFLQLQNDLRFRIQDVRDPLYPEQSGTTPDLPSSILAVTADATKLYVATAGQVTVLDTVNTPYPLPHGN
jgi:hypothetical protein